MKTGQRASLSYLTMEELSPNVRESPNFATKSCLQSTCLGLGSGGLADLDEIAVRVTHVAANLSAVVLGLGSVVLLILLFVPFF